MSATELLRTDHKQIRRLEKVIKKCYSRLNNNQHVPFSDMEKMIAIMFDFLDAIHYAREENQYFPCVVAYDSLKQEVRTFMIEHEFGRRIAANISKYLQKWKEGENQRERVARYLKAYAVYLDDHINKEDKFFEIVQNNVISKDEEQMMYEEFQAVTAVLPTLNTLIQSIDHLEQANWMKS